MEQPTLETDRLCLRQLKVSDSQAIFRNFSDPDVVRYYDLAQFTSEDQAKTLIGNWLKRAERNEGMRWAIVLPENDEVIGTIGFVDISTRNNSAGIGYEIHPDHWNKGIITEAVAEILRHGFTDRAFHRIWAMTYPGNTASQKVLEKNGFQYEGTTRESAFEKGEYVDEAIFGILRSEWLNR